MLIILPAVLAMGTWRLRQRGHSSPPLRLALDLSGTFVFAVGGAPTGLRAARLDIIGMVTPDTLRYRIWHLPARLASRSRQRVLSVSAGWPGKEAFLTCWQRLCALPAST